MQEFVNPEECSTCGRLSVELSDIRNKEFNRIISELYSEKIFTTMPKSCKECIIKNNAFAKCGNCNEKLDNDLVIRKTNFNMSLPYHYLALNTVHMVDDDGLHHVLILEKNVRFDAYCKDCFENMPQIRLSFIDNYPFRYSIDLINDYSQLENLGYNNMTKKSLLKSGKTIRHNGIAFICDNYHVSSRYCVGCKSHRCIEGGSIKFSKQKKKMRVLDEIHEIST